MEEKKENEVINEENSNNENIETVDLEKEDFDKENITRSINLDELYDGAVNNTVIIDPITNNEVLLQTKKNNQKIFGIIAAILILLILYFVNNKLSLEPDKPNVKPNVTGKTTTKQIIKKGMLNCTYTSASSSETQNAIYKLEYENNKIINSSFNYATILSSETSSEIVENLKKQYEDFYLKNSSIEGTNINFEKDEKGFTFKTVIDYANTSFEKFVSSSGETLLYSVPTKDDTIESVKSVYENKGYTCTMNSVNE